eukprot:5996530-Prymnesium_polylepis.1
MTVWQAGSMVLMVHERLLQQVTHVLRWWVRQVRCVRPTSRWSKISQWGMALPWLRKRGGERRRRSRQCLG